MKTKVKLNNRSLLTKHPLVKDFQSLFDSFPHLFDTLSNQVPETNPDDYEVDSLLLKGPEIARQEIFKEPNDVQRIVEHKVFDDSISNLLGKNIMSSVPKHKSWPTNPINSGLIEKIRLENAYRLFGITYFPVVDPSDLRKNEATNEMIVTRDMLGIRLEIFNERDSKFEKPYYILLKKNSKTLAWELFKHTIPVYIDVQNSFQNSTTVPITTYEDVYLFAKEVYINLAKGSERRQQLIELEQEGLVTDLQVDLESAQVSFVLNGLQIQLLLNDQHVVSCFAKDHGDSELGNIEQLFLGPLRELKHTIRHLKN